jgi:hypothetical protein
MLLRAEKRFFIPFVSGLLVAVNGLVPSSGFAQAWLADRSRAEGQGIRTGDVEFHPGIGVELGYDSNLYYSSDEPASDPALVPPRRDSAILRVTPHLLFSTIGEQRRQQGEGGGGGSSGSGRQDQPTVTFRGGVWASYYEYFNDERLRNVSIDAGLRVNILPGRPFSMSLFDDFSRSIRPFTENTFLTTSARDQNTAGIDFTFSTHGNVFQVRTGYRFSVDYFEGEVFRYGNNFGHQFELQETFRFFPQTALLHDTSVAIRDYFQEDLVGPTATFDSVRLTTRVGINGAITPEISALLLVGYAAGFYGSNIPGYDQDFDSFIAHAQLTWTMEQNMRLAIGYMRTFNPSFIGNFMSLDRGFANFQMTLWGSLLLGLEGGVGYADFGQIVDERGGMVGTSTNREDVRVDASLFTEYRFTDWLGINGSLQYQGNFTDFRYVVMTPGGVVIDPASFNKFEAWLGVRAFL